MSSDINGITLLGGSVEVAYGICNVGIVCAITVATKAHLQTILLWLGSAHLVLYILGLCLVLGALACLETLSLGDNRFTGPIPAAALALPAPQRAPSPSLRSQSAALAAVVFSRCASTLRASPQSTSTAVIEPSASSCSRSLVSSISSDPIRRIIRPHSLTFSSSAASSRCAARAS